MKYTNAKNLYSTSIPKSRIKGSSLPRYSWGGDVGQYMKDNAGSLSQAGNVGAAGIMALDQLDGKTSPWASAGAGALKGASMGMAFGPLGAAVGAGVGLVGGAVMGKMKSNAEQEAERQAEIAEKRRKDSIKLQKEFTSMQNSKAILAGYPTSGVADAGFVMAYGGKVPTKDAKYLAEDQEVIQHAENDMPDTDQNGKAVRLNSTTSKFVGDTHEDPSNGIGANNDSNARIFSNRLYVPKDMLKQLKNL